MTLGMAMSVLWSVRLSVGRTTTSVKSEITIQWISLKFCKDFHQSMNPDDFVDNLDFHVVPPAVKSRACPFHFAFFDTGLTLMDKLARQATGNSPDGQSRSDHKRERQDCTYNQKITPQLCFPHC